ncbi:hypothetical protein [Billgrantia gudaonensis]|uniref:Uncharacterized protein n=1 Tax=Billgrantia gudaonensis TaxID=376427 RepID=A0A1G8XG16_9GAMM|nr:hypothetical protein [Halomonas gudaonensis]SDJ89224.1 hypothetical protein SAMN04487954_10924 [Halomonas gudaonensis]
MQCECRAEIETAIRDHVEKTLPEGFQDYDAKLQGYGFALSGSQLTAPFFIEYKGEVQVPKKSGGGMKKQKIDTRIAAKYCPFCGKVARPDEKEA